MEEKARQDYITCQRRADNPDWNVNKCGLFMSLIDLWLAASPDGIIYDPRNSERIVGIVEIKCPYKMREKTLV